MLPLKHLCGELVEQRSMRAHNESLADTLAARPPAKKAKRGGGGGGRGGGRDDWLDGWA